MAEVTSGAAADPNTTEARLKAPNPAPLTWAGAASESPASQRGDAGGRGEESGPLHREDNREGHRDERDHEQRGADDDADGGDHHPRPEEPVHPAVGDAPADDRARDASHNGQRAEGTVRG